MRAGIQMISRKQAGFLLAVLAVIGINCLFPGMILTPIPTCAQPGSIVSDQPPTDPQIESMQTEKEGFGRYLVFTRPKIGMGLSWEFQEEHRRLEGANSKDCQRTSRERAEIETTGWLYNPALAAYTLNYQPEWNQGTEEHEPGSKSSSNSLFLNGYHGDITFLQYKPYTVRLFSDRRLSALKSALAARTDTDSESYGGEFSLKYPVMPTNILYMHFDDTQSGFYHSIRTSDLIRGDIRLNTANTYTHLSTKHQDETRITEGIESRVKSANHDFRNDINFATDRQVQLHSYASFQSTDSKRLDTSNLNVNEDLYWTHAKNFSSDYHADYRSNQWRDTRNENWSLSAGLRHLLYENLTSSGQLFTSMDDYAEGNEQTSGGKLNFDYQRAIPWGMLKLSMGHDYELNHRSFLQSSIIRRQALVLQNTALTYLDQRNVDTASIVIADESGGVIYINGLDYRLSEINGFVRVQRTGFSSIKDGEKVWITYRYLQNPQFDDALSGQDYSIHFELWEMLMLGYRFSHQQQRILSGVAPQVPTNDTTNSVDVKLNWRWTETAFSYTDMARSSGISSTTWLTSEKITIWPTNNLYLQFNGHEGRRKFKDNYRTEHFYGLTGSLNWLPVRWCRYSLEVFQQDLSGQTEITTSQGMESILELSYRVWGGTIRYRFYNEQDKLHDNQRQIYTIYAEIKRALW